MGGGRRWSITSFNNKESTTALTDDDDDADADADAEEDDRDEMRSPGGLPRITSNATTPKV